MIKNPLKAGESYLKSTKGVPSLLFYPDSREHCMTVQEICVSGR
jgi:hypothetical protein